MNKFKILTDSELATFSGGKRVYIPGGNGSWLASRTGTGGVDWNIAGPALGQIVVNGWVQHGPFAHL